MKPENPLFEPMARIDLAALARNARTLLTRVSPRGVLAVVKWNAYGHGLVECAKELERAGVAGFGVSGPRDGILLRKAGISVPILVMTDWVGKPAKLFLDWNLEAAATSWYKVEYLEAVSRTLGHPIATHVKFDTGLGRVGIHHSEADRALRAMTRMRHLQVVGIFSHLDYQGPQDRRKGERQVEVFQAIVRRAKAMGFAPRWIHLANSAAAAAIPDVPGNLVRTGIALYGQPPSAEVHELLPLMPVMTLMGQITDVRRLRQGSGYPSSHYWVARSSGWGAQVALGYSTNYPRSLAGRTEVLFRGRRVPIVGVITRHESYIFTRGGKPEIGEEVVYWGRQRDATLYLYEIAPVIGCLPYELPTWLSRTLARDFVTRAADRNARQVLKSQQG